MDIKDRIKLIIEREDLPSGVFAERIGVQQSTLSHILNGRNKPSLDVVTKIHQTYPVINLEWLLYGKGSMMSASSESHQLQDTYTDFHPSLFDQNSEKAANLSVDQKKRKEIALEPPQNVPKETIIQEIKYVERPVRKITEIRIFFDDNTYETFKGEK